MRRCSIIGSWKFIKCRSELQCRSLRFQKDFRGRKPNSLTDQIRRSSRSVSSAIAEGWRRRKYEKVFVNKLNESESEAAETQVWLVYAVKCGYIDRDVGKNLHKTYDNIIGKLVTMGNNPDPWLLKTMLP